MDPNKKCSTCVHKRDGSRIRNVTAGTYDELKSKPTCHRYPPSLQVAAGPNGVMVFSVFPPIADLDDVCGEYAPMLD